MTTAMGWWLRRLSATLIGPICLFILQILVDDNLWDSVKNNPKFLIGDGLRPVLFAIGLGVLLGWFVDAALRLSEAAEKFENDFREATTGFTEYLRRFFRQPPYSLMLEDTQHSGVVGSLIRNSIETGYKKVLNVDANRYLIYLGEAIEHASTFSGIQRHSMRWFSDTDEGEAYLRKLSSKKMACKRRIFVISDKEESQMLEDLENSELVDEYWAATGGEVETHWIRESDLRERYKIRDPIDDCAIFDDHLFIKYYPGEQILHFDIIPKKNARKKNAPKKNAPKEPEIFERLDEQLQVDEKTPFMLISNKEDCMSSGTKRNDS